MRDARRRPLHIGILAPPWVPIPPPAYGGIEAVVALQAAGLADRGHEVTLAAAPGSRVRGVRVVTPLTELPPVIGSAIDDWVHVTEALEHFTECDMVIDHSGPLGAMLTSQQGPAALHVMHGPADELLGVYATVARLCDLNIAAISRAQTRLAPELPFAGICPNAVDVDRVPFRAEPDAEPYLAFLGRIAPDKGVAAAIRIARQAGIPLRIAAKCREPAEHAHFAEVVQPWLGRGVTYLGELGPDEKYGFLGGARAMLFPIEWEEPFGLVMIEAMACGTPVLATPRGAAPEVVRDGATGFLGDEQRLTRLVARVDEIDRRECRAHVERNFGPRTMVMAYERLTYDLVEKGRLTAASRRRSRRAVGVPRRAALPPPSPAAPR